MTSLTEAIAYELLAISRTLNGILSEKAGLVVGSEVYLSGSLTVVTRDHKTIRGLTEGDLPEVDGEVEVSFSVQYPDYVQCFFEGIKVGPAHERESDGLLPYALGFYTSQALLSTNEPGYDPLLLAGKSEVYPDNFDNLQMGLVVPDKTELN